MTLAARIPAPATQAPAPLAIVSDSLQAAAMLDPARLALLKSLATPASAADLARQTGQPRQRINYHLKELESVGLLRLVEQRKKGNCTERIVQATASAYLVSPEVLGSLGSTKAMVQDRFSSAYLIAVAAEAIREVALLRENAQAAGKQLPTMTVQTHVAVTSIEQQIAVGKELSDAVAKVVAKHHNPIPGSRLFKINLASYPAITKDLNAPTSNTEHAPSSSEHPQ